MTLEQLKVVLQAAAQISDESEFYVIGSAAILHVFGSPGNAQLSRSIEADLIAGSGDPEVADKISVMIGELSPFHDNHDFYADGVTFDTPTFAPKGWKERAIPVHFDDIDITARFMELHDLTLSKLGAGRPKDLEFCKALAATGYISEADLGKRLGSVECDENLEDLISSRIKRIFNS